MKEELGTGSIGNTTANIPDPKDTVMGPSRMGPVLKHYRVLDKRYKKDGKKIKLLKKFKEVRY